MLFDVILNTSIVDSPYDTFQKIKKFTAEYVFPIIDPLIFTIDINVAEIQCLHHAYHHKIVYHDLQPENINDSLLYSTTRFILEDELNQKWNIKVNNLGQLKAFQTNIGNVVDSFALERPDNTFAQISVNSSGDISAIDALPFTPNVNQFSIIGLDETEWFFQIDNSNNVTVTS